MIVATNNFLKCAVKPDPPLPLVLQNRWVNYMIKLLRILLEFVCVVGVSGRYILSKHNRVCACAVKASWHISANIVRSTIHRSFTSVRIMSKLIVARVGWPRPAGWVTRSILLSIYDNDVWNMCLEYLCCSTARRDDFLRLLCRNAICVRQVRS